MNLSDISHQPQPTQAGCPICGFGSGMAYGGVPQCQMPYGASPEGRAQMVADMIKRGCKILAK